MEQINEQNLEEIQRHFGNNNEFERLTTRLTKHKIKGILSGIVVELYSNDDDECFKGRVLGIFKQIWDFIIS